MAPKQKGKTTKDQATSHPGRQAIEDAVTRGMSQRSLAWFARAMWPVLEAAPIKWGWALDAICKHLELVTSGEIKRLVINVPPGSMKSMLVNVLWPAWEWGPQRLDHHRFLSVAHNVPLSVRDSKKLRRLIESRTYQRLWPHVKLTKDQNGKSNFDTVSYGGKVCTSMRSMTGERAHRVTIDDPIAVNDQFSQAALLEAKQIFLEAVPTRVNNEDSAIVMIMQRIHEDDPAGVAINTPELGYTHLCIPMRYEVGESKSTPWFTDPRTEDGELFFPERFDAKTVAALEASLGPYSVASQLQQRPSPRGGGLLKAEYFQFVDRLPDGLRMARGWDLAATQDGGDYTVGMLIGTVGGKTYLCDMVRGRWKSADVARMIRTTGERDSISVPQLLPQDPGSAGKAHAETLTRLMTGLWVETSPETGSKQTRIMPFVTQAEAGNIYVLRAPWNIDLINEATAFGPGCRNDDIIDAISRAFNHLHTGHHLDIMALT